MTDYVFRLDNFNITNTRARHEDTDYVTFALKVGDNQPLIQTKFMDGVNNGVHEVGLEFGPVSIKDPNVLVVFNYIIVNSGHSSNDVEGALNQGSAELLKQDNIKKIIETGSEGGVWGLIGAGAFVGLVEIINLITGANCDGLVAADEVPVSGDALYNWVITSGSHSETRYYPGTDSPVGCGSNSKYFVTWSARFVLIPWNHNDLTLATGAPEAEGVPKGYTWDVDQTQHVVYRGIDGHIHELYYNHFDGKQWKWDHNDLTLATGAPKAVSYPDGYTWDVDKTQHVVYVGNDGHIHELYYNDFDGKQWKWDHNDLTLATGAPTADGDPKGYTWDVDKTQHVVYAGNDSHIHELYYNNFDGKQWKWDHNDLTLATGAPTTSSEPRGYTWDADKTQHVVFNDGGHIHELWFNGQWNHNDLTIAAGAPPAIGIPYGYIWDVDQTQHVIYTGEDYHIHELWFNGQWNHNDLTLAAGTNGNAGDPKGYTWDVDKTQHVVYRGVDGHIHELWFK